MIENIKEVKKKYIEDIMKDENDLNLQLEKVNKELLEVQNQLDKLNNPQKLPQSFFSYFYKGFSFFIIVSTLGGLANYPEAIYNIKLKGDLFDCTFYFVFLIIFFNVNYISKRIQKGNLKQGLHGFLLFVFNLVVWAIDSNTVDMVEANLYKTILAEYGPLVITQTYTVDQKYEYLIQLLTEKGLKIEDFRQNLEMIKPELIGYTIDQIPKQADQLFQDFSTRAEKLEGNLEFLCKVVIPIVFLLCFVYTLGASADEGLVRYFNRQDMLNENIAKAVKFFAKTVTDYLEHLKNPTIYMELSKKINYLETMKDIEGPFQVGGTATTSNLLNLYDPQGVAKIGVEIINNLG